MNGRVLANRAAVPSAVISLSAPLVADSGLLISF